MRAYNTLSKSFKNSNTNTAPSHFSAVLRFARRNDFTGLRPRESDLRRRRWDKVQRNKCDKLKWDSVVAASRRYLKVNVLWRTATNTPLYAFLITTTLLHLLPSFSFYRHVSFDLCIVDISMPTMRAIFRGSVSSFIYLPVILWLLRRISKLRLKPLRYLGPFLKRDLWFLVWCVTAIATFCKLVTLLTIRSFSFRIRCKYVDCLK